MQTPSVVIERTAGTLETLVFESGESLNRTMADMRHRLVDAQVDLLRAYMEKQPASRLIEALDHLIGCVTDSFRTEEALMACLAPGTNHRDDHQAVLEELMLLRRYAIDAERVQLLAQLINVDRRLTEHVSGVFRTAQPESVVGKSQRDAEQALA